MPCIVLLTRVWAGFTLPAMFQGLKQSLSQYEAMIAAEEAAIAAGPAAHQAFLQVAE
jgi:hypothetical protein